MLQGRHHAVPSLLVCQKKYTLMKQKNFPFLSPYDRRSCFYSGTQCGAKNYGAPSKVRAWRGLGEVAFVRGSAQFKPSPAGFFATFLAGTRKVGPRSDRHLQIRRETGRFTLKSWKKVCFITKNAFGGSVTFLCSNKKVTKEIAREGR